MKSLEKENVLCSDSAFKNNVFITANIIISRLISKVLQYPKGY